MSQTIPTLDKTGDRPANGQLVPPDEQFWQRYSPHGELPLSGAASLAVHILVPGLMLLLGWLAYSVFSHTSRTLPVEAVRLDITNPGGGGSTHGKGDGPGVGGAPPVEAGSPTEENANTPDPNDTPKRPELKLDPNARAPLKFDDTSRRVIQQSDTSSSQALQKLAQANIRIRLPDDRKEAGRGKGGTGSGGGSGAGTGTGIGDGRGEGQAGTLTQREKRMLRWSMLFNTNSGPDYVAQLQGLGAILAIPVREDANGREYKIVKDLASRPAKLLDEDIGKIQRIYWIDDKPQSVMDVMGVLGIRLQPSHFVAFMPEELEKKLFDAEKAYLARIHPGKTENDIEITKFRVNRTGRGFEPEVIDQKVK